MGSVSAKWKTDQIPKASVTGQRRATQLHLIPLRFRNPYSSLHVARDCSSNSRDKQTPITRVGYSVNNILSNIFLRVAYSTTPGDSLAPSKLAMRRRSMFPDIGRRVTYGC